jgi:hypothetical protein
MTKKMKEAYRITIYDLEIAVLNCGLFEFKKRKEYNELIKEYENKIYDL